MVLKLMRKYYLCFLEDFFQHHLNFQDLWIMYLVRPENQMKLLVNQLFEKLQLVFREKNFVVNDYIPVAPMIFICNF